MHPFEFLDVPLDADVTAIKRAYARMLRKHRPDEDPLGFQRVHEAYQICLEHAATRARRSTSAAAQPIPALVGDADSPRSDEVPTPHDDTQDAVEDAVANPEVEETEHAVPPRAQAGDPEPTPRPGAIPWPRSHPIAAPPPIPLATRVGSLPEQASFSIESFIVDLLEQDVANRPGLEYWLQHHEPLYSMTLQHSVALPLVNLLMRHESLSPDGLDIVLGFFGLNLVGRAQRAVERQVGALRERAHVEGTERVVRRWIERHPWLPGFIDDLRKIDTSGGPAMHAWLHGREHLQALDTRQDFARPLRYLLSREAQPLSPDGLRVVLRFFDPFETTAQSHANTELLALLESRSRAAWSLRTGGKVASQTGRRPFDPSGLGRLNRWIHRDLTQRFDPVRRLAIVTNPWLAARACSLTRLMEAASPNRHATTTPGSRPSAWWMRAANTQALSWERVILIWGQYLGIFGLIALPVLAAATDSFPLGPFAALYALVSTLHCLVLRVRLSLHRLTARYPGLHVPTLLGSLSTVFGTVCGAWKIWQATVILLAVAFAAAVAKPSNSVRWSALLAILFGTWGTAMSVFAPHLKAGLAGLGVTVSVALPIAVVFAHDVAFAMTRGVVVAEARQGYGWLRQVIASWIAIAIMIGEFAR